MTLLTLFAGILVTHAMVWTLVRNMRRQGEQLKRYHIAAFCLGEVALGLVLWRTGSWPLFLWVAINAGFLALQNRLEPPRQMR